MKVPGKAIVFAAVCAGFAATVLCRQGPAAQRVTPFALRGWGVQGHLLLRLEAEGSEALLLKLVGDFEEEEDRPPGSPEPAIARTRPVYRYDPKEKNLVPVGQDVWDRATTPIRDSDEPRSQIGFEIDPEKEVLRWSGRVIDTAGRTVLKAEASPDGERVAVLSAAGRRRISLMPSFARGRVSGPFYNEILTLPDFKRVGTIKELERKSAGLAMCWSEDNQYVIFTDTYFMYVYIIKVGE